MVDCWQELIRIVEIAPQLAAKAIPQSAKFREQVNANTNFFNITFPTLATTSMELHSRGPFL